VAKSNSKKNSKYIVIISIDEMVKWNSGNRPRFVLWVSADLFGASLNAWTSTAFTYVQQGVRS
jgi:hypothetical protein